MLAFDHVTVHTKRLLLRPLRDSDAPALFAMYSDPRVTRYLSWPAWSSIDTAHERISKDVHSLARGEYVRLGAELLEDRTLIGECSLFNLVAQCRRAEVGYTLAFEAWGRGLMNEALVAFLEFGFSQLGLNRVEADIDPRNTASAKILERLGFKKEGHLRERWIVEGEVSDSSLYGLLLGDWRSGPYGAGCDEA